MLVTALAAFALTCVTWAGAVLSAVHRPTPAAHSKRPRPAARSRPRPRPTPRREEDRVRPAVDASGEPIWVDEEDLFWHEIVCWPGRNGQPGHDGIAAAG